MGEPALGEERISRHTHVFDLSRDSTDSAGGGHSGSDEWGRDFARQKVEDPKYRLKLALVVLSELACFVFAGTIFGWPPLLAMLKQEGFYADLCSDGAAGCEAQEAALTVVYTCSAVAQTACAIVVGLITFNCGLRCLLVVGCVLEVIGLYLLVRQPSAPFSSLPPDWPSALAPPTRCMLSVDCLVHLRCRGELRSDRRLCVRCCAALPQLAGHAPTRARPVHPGDRWRAHRLRCRPAAPLHLPPLDSDRARLYFMIALFAAVPCCRAGSMCFFQHAIGGISHFLPAKSFLITSISCTLFDASSAVFWFAKIAHGAGVSRLCCARHRPLAAASRLTCC